MGVIAWIVLGAITGVIAQHLAGRRTGLLMATVVGIVGALLGGFLAEQLFHVRTVDSFFDVSTWITAIIGAVVLILLVRALQSNGSRRRPRTRARSRSWRL